MEGKMAFKHKKYTPQEMIQIGMMFFLLGVLVNMIADGRMIGAFVTKLITNSSLLHSIQGFSAGFSIPILGASIYFNIRGLTMLRSRK
jgi:hypothetical protein